MTNLNTENVLQGIAPGWHELINKELLSNVLLKIQPDEQYLTPPSNLMFECLRYFEPEETKLVIIAQDPYPKPGDAMGLAFGTLAHNVPQSLQNIHAALKKSGLMKPENNGKDVRPWAAQGALLMNRALSTVVNKSNAHQQHWKTFTTDLIKQLCVLTMNNKKQLIFMLWGNNAQELIPAIAKYNHIILKRPHPSPMADNNLPSESRFVNCTHFTETNKFLSNNGVIPFEWDIHAFNLAFTDGACTGNGKEDADASFAVFIASGPASKTSIIGRVEPYKYIFRDDNDILKGFDIDSDISIKPSNNRGEYLAWCWCLYILIKAHALGSIEIISDCNLFIQTMEDWLPTRLKKGTEQELKNYDLIYIGYKLLNYIRHRTINVKLTHTHAAHDISIPEDTRGRVIWAGNNKVDKLATNHLKNIDNYSIDIESYMPVLKLIE